MNEIERIKILVGILIGLVIIGTTFLLYITGDTTYIARFMVYSEAYIGLAITWVGLREKKEEREETKLPSIRDEEIEGEDLLNERS